MYVRPTIYSFLRLIFILISCSYIEGQIGDPCITELNVTVHSASELQVSWLSSHCNPDGYLVEYELINLDHCRGAHGSVTSPVTSENELLITGLQPYSLYKVCVRTVTSGLYGMRHVRESSTGEAVPTDSPANVRSIETTPSGLGFAWDVVPCGNRSGVVTGYTYNLKDNSQEIVGSGRTSNRFVTVSDLMENTAYTFRVAAETNAGIGPYSSSVSATTTGLMFPFGESVGDTFIPSNDDGSSDEIFISTLFPYFDANHDSLYVNTNGVISFLTQVAQYTPAEFPLGDGRRLITPYWSDVDTRRGGNNSFREILRSSETENWFQEVDGIVRRSFVEDSRFKAIWMFIATWDRVGFYGSASPHIVNTFQAVLVTNGRHSFAVFNYENIQWTTGTASGGDGNTGLGGIPAQAGFNAGDGMRFFSIPGSQTADIVNIETTSNVGVPGRWVFRVDEAEIDDRRCISEGSFVTYPTIGSMLGGDIIYIAGPCFNPDMDFIKCKFDDIIVTGNHEPNERASCVTPTVFFIGRISLSVSTDGGENYNFQGIFTYVSVDQVNPRIERINALRWYQDLPDYDPYYEITWDTTVFDGVVEYVDIDIVGYSEETEKPSINDVFRLASNVLYSTGRHTVTPFSLLSFRSNGYYPVGMISVSEHTVGISIGTTQVKPTLWSDVHSLQWLYDFPSGSTCDKWAKGEMEPENIPACPCTLTQALVDIGRFSPHPNCDIDNVNADNCFYKQGAVHCVRATQPSSLGRGVECCFGDDDNILSVATTEGGGFSHRSHHAGIAPFRIKGKIPYFSNFVNDVEPWMMCCLFSNDDNRCSAYKERRPSQTCEGYVPPQPAGGSGDPHVLTLDGTSYTFNGKGEYIMLHADPTPDTNGDDFLLQARTNTLADTDEATVFVAVAARQGSSDTVHIEVSERHILDVWILGSTTDTSNQTSNWRRLDFEESNWWNLNGVRIRGRNISDTGVLVIFDNGVSLELKATQGANRAMSILFLGPQYFRNHTSGLLGTWNGNPDDDFLSPDGSLIPSNSSTETIHYNFGQQWQIALNESLFYYREGFSPEYYKDETFRPIFDTPQPAQDVVDACDGNEWCIFDYQVTRDMEVAIASKIAYEEQIAVVNASQEVTVCEALEQIPNGNIQITRSNVDGIALHSCADGFILEGEDERICLESGEWSGEPPICVRSPPKPGRVKCQASEFTCSNADCIPRLNVCDKIRHCSDGSDEIPTLCFCKDNRFKCRNGACIPEEWTCNGRNDCGDMSDELINCKCQSSKEFPCASSDECILLTQVCNGTPDCADASDEVQCGCKSHQFSCGNGACIPSEYICNGRNDCGDYSDERNQQCKP